MKPTKLIVSTFLVVAMLAIGSVSAFASSSQQDTKNSTSAISNFLAFLMNADAKNPTLITSKTLDLLKNVDVQDPAVIQFLDSLKKPDANNVTIIVSRLHGIEPVWVKVTSLDGSVYYIDPPIALINKKK